MQALSERPTGLLQCFDTVGLVIWPVKIVRDMTYNVFGGTLNLAQSSLSSALIYGNACRCAGHMRAFLRLRGSVVSSSTRLRVPWSSGLLTRRRAFPRQTDDQTARLELNVEIMWPDRIWHDPAHCSVVACSSENSSAFMRIRMFLTIKGMWLSLYTISCCGLINWINKNKKTIKPKWFS